MSRQHKSVKRKYITPAEYDGTHERCFEYVDGVSQTVPGEAFSVGELFERQVDLAGMRLERDVHFEDTEDFDFPDLSRLGSMDIFDRKELLDQAIATIEDAQAKLDEYFDQKKKEANEQSVESDPVADDSVESGEPDPAPVDP